MKRSTKILHPKLVTFLIASLAGVIYLGSTVWSFSSKNKSTVIVNNRTHSLEVLKAENHNGHLKLLMQNHSDKAITSYVFTYNPDAQTVETFREEFATSEADLVILPGSVYEKVLGFSPSFNGQGDITLNLSAVVFEDKSGEGDPVIIKGIEEDRLGQKIQLLRSLPILDR